MSKPTLLRRTAEMVLGWITWKAVDYAFDYVLYPFVIWKLGLLPGGCLMSVLSLLSCLLSLHIYDRLGRDWLGIEFVKESRHYKGDSRYRHMIGRLLASGDWLAYVVLSLRYDPFITTAYLRREAYNGMNQRDWRVFLGSWLLGNMFWIFVCYGGISFLRRLL